MRQPSWTRQPWISKEFLAPPGERSEEAMVDVDIDQGGGGSRSRNRD